MFDNHIFIISLKNFLDFSKKRTEILEKRLKNLNFNLNNINYIGILGTKLIRKRLNKKYISHEIYDFDSHIGTLGASLSHALILKLIQIKKLNGDVLVFEEDAVLNDNFCSILTKLPNNYDLAYFHSYWDVNFFSQTEGLTEEIYPKGYKSCSFGEKQKFINFDKELKIPDNIKHKYKNILFNKITRPPDYNTPSGIMVYSINANNIDKIINCIFPLKESADWHYLKQFNNLNQYYANPHLKLISSPSCDKSLRLTLDNKFIEYKKSLKLNSY